MKKVIVTALMLPLMSASLVMAQGECVPGQSTSVGEIVTAVSTNCCSKSSSSKQNRCVGRAIKRIGKAKRVLGASVDAQVKTALRALRTASCDLAAVVLPACTAESSTSVTEAVANISDGSCSLKFQDSRVKKLTKMRRSVSNVKRFLSSEFVASVNEQVKGLRRAQSCGQGGQERTASQCGRTISPRDGANGNVYKLSDHGGTPVFVTHNGARSGEALTLSGKRIETLRYTGLANADPQGLRHHYRLSSSCSSLPNPYLLRVGSTCYTIDNPCGRID